MVLKYLLKRPLQDKKRNLAILFMFFPMKMISTSSAKGIKSWTGRRWPRFAPVKLFLSFRKVPSSNSTLPSSSKSPVQYWNVTMYLLILLQDETSFSATVTITISAAVEMYNIRVYDKLPETSVSLLQSDRSLRKRQTTNFGALGARFVSRTVGAASAWP